MWAAFIATAIASMISVLKLFGFPSSFLIKLSTTGFLPKHFSEPFLSREPALSSPHLCSFFTPRSTSSCRLPPMLAHSPQATLPRSAVYHPFHYQFICFCAQKRFLRIHQHIEKSVHSARESPILCHPWPPGSPSIKNLHGYASTKLHPKLTIPKMGLVPSRVAWNGLITSSPCSKLKKNVANKTTENSLEENQSTENQFPLKPTCYLM